MLTTLKTQSVTKWTWSGTGFVRESPGEKQLAVPKRRQVYKRARYYDTATGEFISRDPKEYVDGMSQYRAYFVPKGTDPKGLAITMAQCEAAKAAAKLNNDAVVETLEVNPLCKPPEIQCKECAGSKNPSSHFDPETEDIVICIDQPGITVALLPQIFTHEYVHAQDNCSGADFTKCDDLICSEIRAYSFANCEVGSVWRWKGSTKEECIKHGAWASTVALEACNVPERVDVRERIKVLYPVCKVDRPCSAGTGQAPPIPLDF